MVDSTRIVLPVSEAFKSGTLEMQEEAARGFERTALAWSDYPVNVVLIVFFTILALFTLKRFLNILPRLLDSLTRWKACLSIDASIQIKSDRNFLGLLYTIPIALMADKFNLLHIDALNIVPEGWRGLSMTVLVFIWLLLRRLMFLFCAARTRKFDLLRTAYQSFFNYWILIGFLIVCTATISLVIGLSSELTGKVILYEIAALYLIAVLRKSQILNSFCNPFVTFLYLCALEFLPTGALIAGVILF